MTAMSLLSTRNRTSSNGSCYASSEDVNEFGSRTDATSTQPCSLSHLSTDFSRTRSEDRQALLGVSTTEHHQSNTYADPVEGRCSNSSKSISDKTGYHTRMHDDVGRPRSTTAEPRQPGYDPNHYSIRTAPRKYRRMSVADGSSSQSEKREAPGANTDTGDVFNHRSPPGLTKSSHSSHAGDKGQKHSFYEALASINPDEHSEGPDRGAAVLRRASQRPASFGHEIDESTSQLRRNLLSNISSALKLEQVDSSTSDRKMHREAALQALGGAGESSERPKNVAANCSLHVNRRQGRVDWQRATLFSSKGRQYSLGDHDAGYLSGRYVTWINQEIKKPDKNKKLRGSKCFLGP